MPDTIVPPMTNEQVADVFTEVADLLEFQGSSPFRIRAYRNGARTIRDLPESLAALRQAERPLTELAGIGKELAEKCHQLIDHGRLPQLDQLRQEIPESVLALLRIPGLGPKKAAILHRELGIQSLAELQAACEAQRVRELKGFGAKTEELILKGIPLAASAGQRILWAQADAIVQQLLTWLRGCASIHQIQPAGSYRRGKETVGDLDFLVDATDPDKVMDRLAAYPDVDATLLRGSTKMSVRLASGLQVDLRCVPNESFGAALQYFTGSQQHNVVLRGMAKRRGLRLNEWGVYQDDQAIAGATEADVYAALDLPEFPPELREARQEFQWALDGPLPSLVQLDDIRGDLHMHTTDTDGTSTLEQMVAAAQQRKWRYIAITDHSKRVAMANGLDEQRILQQWKRIDRLNQSLQGSLTILKGVECDILEAGGMDLPDDVLQQADWVVASIHYGQNQPRQQITDRLLGAIENPHVDVLGHPTGRILNRREAYDVDMEAVMAAARQYRTLLELNANPNRLDLNDVHCAAAKQLGIPIVISTDAHSAQGMDVMRFGIMQARRAGLTKDDVANTRSWSQLRKLRTG